ncbi:hypothetical protein HDV05_003366 [Chytridiales sp. JEL 0842]|nr:hypothetical protein HDV05_003366 [Chytridiales sp. JEL 0842]
MFRRQRRNSAGSDKTSETTFSQRSLHPPIHPFTPAEPRPGEELMEFMGEKGIVTGVDCFDDKYYVSATQPAPSCTTDYFSPVSVDLLKSIIEKGRMNKSEVMVWAGALNAQTTK